MDSLNRFMLLLGWNLSYVYKESVSTNKKLEFEKYRGQLIDKIQNAKPPIIQAKSGVDLAEPPTIGMAINALLDQFGDSLMVQESTLKNNQYQLFVIVLGEQDKHIQNAEVQLYVSRLSPEITQKYTFDVDRLVQLLIDFRGVSLKGGSQKSKRHLPRKQSKRRKSRRIV